MSHTSPDELEPRIGEKHDPWTGEVTMFLADVPGGPIVTGSNREDALRRMRNAMPVFRVANLLMLRLSGRMN